MCQTLLLIIKFICAGLFNIWGLAPLTQPAHLKEHRRNSNILYIHFLLLFCNDGSPLCSTVSVQVVFISFWYTVGVTGICKHRRRPWKSIVSFPLVWNNAGNKQKIKFHRVHPLYSVRIIWIHSSGYGWYMNKVTSSS